jgi:hypothetical protein
MVKITYENYRDVECKHAKYVSRIKGKLMLHIIDFLEFRRRLLDEYSDDEIIHFFRIFPFTLDTEINQEIEEFVIKQELDYYEDLQLIEISGKEFVLVDENSELLEGWNLLDRIRHQPIPVEEFKSMVFDDFIAIDTSGLLLGIEDNVRRMIKKEEKPKYVETAIKDGVYI